MSGEEGAAAPEHLPGAAAARVALGMARRVGLRRRDRAANWCNRSRVCVGLVGSGPSAHAQAAVRLSLCSNVISISIVECLRAAFTMIKNNAMHSTPCGMPPITTDLQL